MSNYIGKEFMYKTKYKFLEIPDQRKGLPQPPYQLEYDESLRIIDLPKPDAIKISDVNLREVIEGRKSVRNYSEKAITLSELSWLLWSTQGVREIYQNSITMRNVPSAGARHAFETYLLINNVEGLKTGIYRFLAFEHKLIEINIDKKIADKVVTAVLNQNFIKNSATTFIWTAVPYRMTWRYSQRGYRYLLIDAGHVCQNLYLAAANINCGVCAIAAFNDEELNDLLEIDGETQFVIYLATIGKKE